ncbi:hypothetical protein ACJRO7_033469 [Eucalyptus globulus]|uniref:pectinesterase n=1 Tax=Eucalyptus globulus TaxID=34317 RepID=A0ABD3JRM1_EUCGL
MSLAFSLPVLITGPPFTNLLKFDKSFATHRGNGSKKTCLAILIAVLAVFSSTNFIVPVLLSSLRDLSLDAELFTCPSSGLSPLFGWCLGRHHHRHCHKHPDDSQRTVSICDNFPPDIPPPETNTTVTLCVDQNGCCNFTTVQAAVDAAGNFSQKRTVIWINSGIYYKKVTILRTRPNITFQGQGYLSTAIAWNGTANSSGGTFCSGSVGRHYFRDCYIQGSIHFIFGDAGLCTRYGSPLLHKLRGESNNCQLISIAAPVPPGQKVINGAVTAHGRASKDENTGFAFMNANIGGTGIIWLGRAWRPLSRAVFAFTTMTDIIAPEGWKYNCSRAGANKSLRTPYVQRLNDTQALPFLNISFIDRDQWL